MERSARYVAHSPPNPVLVRIVARAMLAAAPSPASIADRLADALGSPFPWLLPLARRYLKSFPTSQTRPRLRSVVRFLENDAALQRACLRHRVKLAQWTTGPQPMQPVPAAVAWPVPALNTIAGLAAWLDLTPTELAWFADRKHLNAKAPGPERCPLQHYHYRVLAKPHGTPRLIEVPKPRLKLLQTRILRDLLDHIPSHPAAHGFRKGRSIATFAAPHVGRAVVLRMDLHDFFPSFSAARVQAFFRTAGYPETVADLLAGICTNVTPRAIWKSTIAPHEPETLRQVIALHAQPHLPQGAPTSPALANIMTYRADCRLTGLAQAAGATYTRYADDLAFSGPLAFARQAERFAIHVAAALQEEGLRVHHRKTRVMRPGVRQYLAGVVTNQRLNVPRPDFDRLKATLTNCIRHGWASQNRDDLPEYRSHLAGKVAFVESINSAKAVRLRRLLDQIDWT